MLLITKVSLGILVKCLVDCKERKPSYHCILYKISMTPTWPRLRPRTPLQLKNIDLASFGIRILKEKQIEISPIAQLFCWFYIVKKGHQCIGRFEKRADNYDERNVVRDDVTQNKVILFRPNQGCETHVTRVRTLSFTCVNTQLRVIA